MDTETVKLRPCDHARVVVFDDEHIVFGESCSQLGRPGLAEGDTARVVGPRLHDGDGWTPVECGLDGADNWAFGIDRDADHLGARKFEHVKDWRERRRLNDHPIAVRNGAGDESVEGVLGTIEQGDALGVVRPAPAEFDFEVGKDGPVEIAGDLMAGGGLRERPMEVREETRVGRAGREVGGESTRLNRHVPRPVGAIGSPGAHGGASASVGFDHAARPEDLPRIAYGRRTDPEVGGKARTVGSGCRPRAGHGEHAGRSTLRSPRRFCLR